MKTSKDGKSYGAVQAAKDLILGRLEFADENTVAMRRETCNSCEVRNDILDTCTACGCLLPAKIRLTLSTCPLGMW